LGAFCQSLCKEYVRYRTHEIPASTRYQALGCNSRFCYQCSTVDHNRSSFKVAELTSAWLGTG
jgi:hypothetical protein